ncbi:MAG: D-ribose pyranase [Treponema sp.]|jgi:D-ribose pyranase|nr:D-ribose pyranase [Treponema sp.]
MKKGKILNRALNSAIAEMGHGDVLMVCDAGFPIPRNGVTIVDLAITQDLPSVLFTAELLISDFIYERVIVAEENKLYNPVFHQDLKNLIDRCPVETVPHTDILEKWKSSAKVFIRSGGLEPWGNIVFVSGIDAAAYFSKKGAIPPDYFKDRVAYKEK